MADNVVANAGSGGATFATDDIGGTHYPIGKIAHGVADSATLVSTSSGLPVQQQGTWNVTNVSGTVSLPTGASTAAKQPALGTAGVSSTDVLSVQGIASGTAMPVSIASVPSHAVTNAGTFAVQESGGQIIADDAAFTAGASKVQMAGFVADETATDSVNEDDAGAARMTLDRKQIVSQYAHTAGGWTPSKTVSAATTNATSLKASAGQVGFIFCSNVNAAARYLKLYNKASAPTVGTDTPVLTLAIPGNTAGAGFALATGSGIEFTTGIAFALTTEATDAGSTAVAASEIVVNIGYK